MHNNTTLTTKYIDPMFIHASHGYQRLKNKSQKQWQHRSQVASLDCVVKTVSKNLDSNLLVRFNIWTLGRSNAK